MINADRENGIFLIREDRECNLDALQTSEK